MQKIKNRFRMMGVMMLTVCGLVGLVLAAQPAMAVTCPAGSVNPSANTLAECNMTSTGDGIVRSTVPTIINGVLGVIGFVAVVIIIFGGVQFATSAGDPAKAAKAKNTIVFAVVGLIIALLAFAIVNFVLNNILKEKAADEEETSYAPSSLVVERVLNRKKESPFTP